MARFGASLRYAGTRMDGDPKTAPAPRSDELRAGRLDSWKEIAAFLGRGIRTVQRWEREEGLPVHRLAHEKRGSIYARREELAAWWESRRLTLTPNIKSKRRPIHRRFERVTRTSAHDHLAGAVVRRAPDRVCLGRRAGRDDATDLDSADRRRGAASDER